MQVLAYAREDATSFIHKGGIYNIDKTAQALTSIINKLESQLNNSIAKVYVGISGQSLRTVKNTVSRVFEEEGIISQELVDAICDENLEIPLIDMSVLDVAPQEYKIDNNYQADPVGVAGKRITGNFLNIVARASLKKNLEHSFEQAKVEIADLVIAPIALAKAVLTESEMRSGCALIDFGADTTTLLIYKNNILRFLSVLPLGGNNITRDITSLHMEETEAEQLKQKYGDLLYKEEDSETPAVCQLEDGRSIELSVLNDIIEARTEEINREVHPRQHLWLQRCTEERRHAEHTARTARRRKRELLPAGSETGICHQCHSTETCRHVRRRRNSERARACRPRCQSPTGEGRKGTPRTGTQEEGTRRKEAERGREEKEEKRRS